MFLEHKDWITLLAVNLVLSAWHRVGTGKIFLAGKNEMLPTASL